MKSFCLLVSLVALLSACADSTSKIFSDGGAGFGGEKGNGAEYIIDGENSAWFPFKNLTLDACVEIDPNFGVSRSDIQTAIATAERAWFQYLTEKSIQVPLAVINSWDWAQHPCRGHEKIHYYFGVKTPDVENAMVKFTRPIAFAKRTFHDPRTRESRGFIWIAPHGSLNRAQQSYPDWTLPYNLAGILMHELGHVYGVDHVPETIMDARIADFLVRSEGERKSRLANIDSYRDLYICLDCEVSKMGALGIKDEYAKRAEDPSALRNFELLTGRAPIGPVIARLEGRITRQIRLHLDDFAGEFDFDLEFDRTTLNTGLGGAGETQGIFRTARLGDDGNMVVEAVPHGSRTLYGQIKTVHGELIPIVVEINMTTQISILEGVITFDGLTIKMLRNGRPQILFFSAAYQN